MQTNSGFASAADILSRFHCEDGGQDLIEYALVAALIALGAVVSMNSLASSINVTFNKVASRLSTNVS